MNFSLSEKDIISDKVCAKIYIDFECHNIN